MHWSKTRHVDYAECPRRFFFTNIASPRNPAIRALATKSSPHLIRHDLVRSLVRTIISAEDWDVRQLPDTINKTAETLQDILKDEMKTAAQISIIDECLMNFCAVILPDIRGSVIKYLGESEPVEFIYNGLSIMALPELVIEGKDALEIMSWKTGLSNFHDGEALRLRAGGLTCWARAVLKCVDKPIVVSDVFLREGGARIAKSFADGELTEFIGEAKKITAAYGVSARIKDFPARPEVGTCRFCSFQSICPEWQAFSEVDYEIKTLSEEVARGWGPEKEALKVVGGEIRDVFLSHAGQDTEEYVRPFARLLEAEGVSFWLDEAELQWGDPLFQSINRGLAISTYCVCFVSDAFLDGGWTEGELGGVFAQQMAEGKKKILPLRIASMDRIKKDYPLLANMKMESWKRDELESFVKKLKQLLVKTETS